MNRLTNLLDIDYGQFWPVVCVIVEMIDRDTFTIINPLKEHAISSRLCSKSNQ